MKAEAIYDTRQVVEASEGYLLFYPKKPVLDKIGEDINAHGSINQYAMMSRLKVKISGPDVLGAKASALIEGDFTGASNSENNSMRLWSCLPEIEMEPCKFYSGSVLAPD